jgi:hypothetical protein
VRRPDRTVALGAEHSGIPKPKTACLGWIARLEALQDRFLAALVLGDVNADDEGRSGRHGAAHHRAVAIETGKRPLGRTVPLAAAAEAEHDEEEGPCS